MRATGLIYWYHLKVLEKFKDDRNSIINRMVSNPKARLHGNLPRTHQQNMISYGIRKVTWIYIEQN